MMSSQSRFARLAVMSALLLHCGKTSVMLSRTIRSFNLRRSPRTPIKAPRAAWSKQTAVRPRRRAIHRRRIFDQHDQDASPDDAAHPDAGDAMAIRDGSIRTVESVLRAKSPDCFACAQLNCGNPITSCGSLTGVAKEGPAQGTPKAELCIDTLACVIPDQCGVLKPSTCVNGPCMDALERSFESTDPPAIAALSGDITHAGAWAMLLLQCLVDNRCASCL